ncbi:MAG: hypothetical protein JW789_00880 [Candidatus Aenigmarchaeota archaeon]|nr:hypothetical protein [Candidatus Aenigmarchaeota archaeon]
MSEKLCSSGKTVAVADISVDDIKKQLTEFESVYDSISRKYESHMRLRMSDSDAEKLREMNNILLEMRYSDPVLKSIEPDGLSYKALDLMNGVVSLLSRYNEL